MYRGGRSTDVCIRSHLPIHSARANSLKCFATGSTGSKRPGWQWPFSQQVDAVETEVVYVSDTAEADEVVEETENQQTARYEQLHAVQHGSFDDSQHSPATAINYSTQTHPASEQLLVHAEGTSEDGRGQVMPEVTATATLPAQLSRQQSVQQQAEPVAAVAATSSVNSAGGLGLVLTQHVVSSPPAAFATPSYWSTAAGGWVVALSMLLAVRQGRAQADAARLDVRALQARQHESRIQSRTLRDKRAQYLKEQQLLKEEAAAKRPSEQGKEAERTRREAAAKAAEYEKAAREELEKLRARRAAAKKAFEESQGKLDEELAARTAREIALREELEAKKAAEETERRAAAAAEAAQAAAEAAAAAKAAEEAAEQAAAARAALKQQQRDSSYRYQIKLIGSTAAAPVSAEGRQSQLSVTITLSPDSGDRGNGQPAPAPVAVITKVFDDSDAAVDGSPQLAAHAAEQVYNHYIPAAVRSNADIQGLTVFCPATSSGSSHQQSAAAQTAASAAEAIMQLSRADKMLWRLLLLSQIEAAGRRGIGQVAPLAATGELHQDFKVQATFSSLPMSDSNCLQQRLTQCADLVAQQQLPAAIQVLNDIIEWQLEDFAGCKLAATSSTESGAAAMLQQLVASGAATTCPASPYIVPACVYAVLLDLCDPQTQSVVASSVSAGARVGSAAASPEASASSSPDASARDDDNMFDADEMSGSETPNPFIRQSIVRQQDSPLQRLVKFQLEQLEKAAPADELTSVGVCLQQLLGRMHPVSTAMQLLAERNMSPSARQARALRQQQRQLAKATELLQGSSSSNPGLGSMQRQLAPAPERIWALRNVANNMLKSTASSGGGSAVSSSVSTEEAVSMLQQASALAAEHYGSNSPGRLSALLDYVSAVLTLPGHQQAAKEAIEAVCCIVAAVGERYRQQKDLLSLVLLYESTQAELDVPEVIGRECVAMTRLQRQASDAFSVLETAQANLVMSKRKLLPGSSRTALRQLARECTEQLGGSVAVKRRDTLLDQWNKGLLLKPLR